MLKTTKIIISQKKELVNTAQELLQHYGVNCPNLTEQAFMLIDCRTAEDAFQTIGIYAENKEELTEWIKLIQQYETKGEDYEYDFCTFISEIPGDEEVLRDVLGERNRFGMYETNLYTFEF